MSSNIRSQLLLPILASFVLVACGGSVEGVPNPSGASNASGASSSGGSSGSGASAGSAGAGGTCTMAPACNKGDSAHAGADTACIEIAGVSCYERTACGTTIWCQHWEGDRAQCDGLPACDPGWNEVKGCVPDAECKKVTTCGTSIICEKVDPTCEGPQPICDPGDKEIAGSFECGPPNTRCYTRSNLCGTTIWCSGPA